MELDELIKSIDIVEYLSQFIELEQRGDEFWGLSPLKDEHTPSFSVRKEPPVFLITALASEVTYLRLLGTITSAMRQRQSKNSRAM